MNSRARSQVGTTIVLVAHDKSTTRTTSNKNHDQHETRERNKETRNHTRAHSTCRQPYKQSSTQAKNTYLRIEAVARREKRPNNPVDCPRHQNLLVRLSSLPPVGGSRDLPQGMCLINNTSYTPGTLFFTQTVHACMCETYMAKKNVQQYRDCMYVCMQGVLLSWVCRKKCYLQE